MIQKDIKQSIYVFIDYVSYILWQFTWIDGILLKFAHTVVHKMLNERLKLARPVTKQLDRSQCDCCRVLL